MTKTITTKVRPIRKLFIIDSHDIGTFEKVISKISTDIEFIFNIFLINDENIFSDINKEFVKRHNIDIVLNLSVLENKIIEDNFLIESITPNDDTTKIERFVTYFYSISNLPSAFSKYNDTTKDKILYSNKYERGNYISAMSSINFGLLNEEPKKLSSNSVFENIKFISCETIQTIKENIFDKESHYSRIHNIVNPFSTGYGSSIYEIDYSHPEHFKKDIYIFVSSLNDLEGIIYFWNMRASNPSKEFFWFPEESIKDMNSVLTDEMIFIVTNENLENKIKNCSLKNKILVLDKLYFYSTATSWNLYEHTQTLNIQNRGDFSISHPIEKSFSTFGIGGACIIEISGLKNFFYPTHSKIGELFKVGKENSSFPERFTHLNNKKLSKYYLDFNPFEMQDLYVQIKLPIFKEVVEFLFDYKNLKLKSTKKTFILEQLINSIGGLYEVNQLCDERVFKLIEIMTPTVQTKKMITSLNASLDHDKANETIGNELNMSNIQFKPIISEYSNIKSEIKDENIIQTLYNKKFLLRGKSFNCSHCSSYIWLPFENINRVNYCDTCNNEVQIPVNKDGNDKYRINQLLINAYHQGQLSTLFLLNFFTENTFFTLDFLSNQEIFKQGNKKAHTDLDLIIKIGNRIGFAECKSTSTFSKRQIDDLLDIGRSIKCDFYMLSCLKNKDDIEILETIKYIETKNINKPVFIFTKEVLFKPKSVNFYKYFEVEANKFKQGPVLLAR
ncbi:MAG: hypothetical protein HRT41_12900 [Campylobacteraceae bacterium]|nr:hypothetical protein [Campylobacteraceae bacterium]